MSKGLDDFPYAWQEERKKYKYFIRYVAEYKHNVETVDQLLNNAMAYIISYSVWSRAFIQNKSG